MRPKLVFVAGEPATGKTTLMLEVVKRLGGFGQDTRFHYGKLRGHRIGKIWLLGVYDGGVFGGTDRLSMTAVTDAVPFLKTVQTCDSVLLEGDRLFNKTFLDAACRDCESHLFMTTAGEPELHARHLTRGDTQKAAWLKGRRTKCANLGKAYPFAALKNENEEDLARNALLLVSLLQ